MGQQCKTEGEKEEERKEIGQDRGQQLLRKLLITTGTFMGQATHFCSQEAPLLIKITTKAIF